MPCRPLVMYDTSFFPDGQEGVHPSILKYAPGIQEFPEDLVGAATKLKDAEKECKEVDDEHCGLQEAFWAVRDSSVKMDAIKSKIQECAAREAVSKQKMLAQRREFLAAAISHTQTYCQGLSEKIVKSLPREVRDMIYVYLCDRIKRVSIRPNKEEEVEEPYIQRLETPVPYLFSQKYLQKDFLSELAESFYKTATFHIWDADDISACLTQNILHTDCTPADHIRKLSLVVFTDEFGSQCFSRRQIREKISQLYYLLDIRYRTGFHLDLHLCIHHSRLRPIIARYHQLLLPYMHSFLAAGFALRFPLRKYHYDRYSRSDRSRANQLQASDSKDPADWVVDAGVLATWEESEDVRDAFLKSSVRRGGYWDFDYQIDYDYDTGDEDEGDAWDEELPEDFVDGDVDSEDEGWMVED